MDEDKLHSAIVAGEKAEAMLAGGHLEPMTFKMACATLGDELMKEWKASKSIEAREKVWACIHLLERIEDRLVAIAGNGAIAKEDLNRIINSRKK